MHMLKILYHIKRLRMMTRVCSYQCHTPMALKQTLQTFLAIYVSFSCIHVYCAHTNISQVTNVRHYALTSYYAKYGYTPSWYFLFQSPPIVGIPH